MVKQRGGLGSQRDPDPGEVGTWKMHSIILYSPLPPPQNQTSFLLVVAKVINQCNLRGLAAWYSY